MFNTFNNHPLARLAVLFGVGIILVLVFILWSKARRNSGIEELDALQRRLQFSNAGLVTPSAAVLEELRQANERLERLDSSLDKALFRDLNDPSRSESNGDSTSAFFELAEFVESMAQKFEHKRISLPDKTRFGFMEFKQQGPDIEILSGVLAQRIASEHVLEPLLSARPISLVGLKREFLETEPDEQSLLQQAAGNRSSRRTHPEDTIEMNSKEDEFESYNFELVFEGHTESLRQYLAGILASPLPILVNELEVTPLNRFGSDESQSRSNLSSNPFDLITEEEPATTEDGPVPIIRNNLSAFRLLLEVYVGKEPDQDA